MLLKHAIANSIYTVKNDILNLCRHVAAVNPISSYCKNINAIRYFYNIRLCDVQLSGKLTIQSVYDIWTSRQ